MGTTNRRLRVAIRERGVCSMNQRASMSRPGPTPIPFSLKALDLPLDPLGHSGKVGF
jgi:hypothetical protein